jgi:hypothetical protein
MLVFEQPAAATSAVKEVGHTDLAPVKHVPQQAPLMAKGILSPRIEKSHE